MTGLGDLLEAARKASRQDRISLRNDIAAYGHRAIPAMRDWIEDAEFGAFAVRVLERIAEQPTDRGQVIEALESIDQEAVTAPVASDITNALVRLGRRKHHVKVIGSARGVPAPWPGYKTASPLEQRFHDDMLDIFRLAGEATRKQRSDGTFIRGYWASYFLRGVRNHGGLPYARQLLDVEGTTAGFARLTNEGRLDLTMEALVLRPEYLELFSTNELQAAKSRLARAGWSRAR